MVRCAPPPAPETLGSPGRPRRGGGGGAMASFERLNVQRARRPSADGGEGSVWRRFRHPLTFRHKAAPTHVEFSPVAPHDFAVASSLQVDVFSTRTTAIYRSLTRFKDVVHCCSYRGDGKMLAAGLAINAVLTDLNLYDNRWDQDNITFIANIRPLRIRLSQAALILYVTDSARKEALQSRRPSRSTRWCPQPSSPRAAACHAHVQGVGARAHT